MSPTSSGAAWTTCCMAKRYCCRFHNVFMALLVLSVFSLIGHFALDIVHPPHPQTIERLSDGSDTLGSPDTGHATTLHAGYLLAETPRLSAARPPLHMTDTLAPDEVAWQPATPLRPPISI